MDRDNGRTVRRRFAFPTQIINTQPVTVPSGQYGYSFLNPAGLGNNALIDLKDDMLQRYSRRTTDVWFSGAFTYNIPTDKSVLGKLQAISAKAQVLMGARVDPSVVWELAPWSWLIDWKLGIGNLLSNASAFSDDGLVIRYGYLMRHTMLKETYTTQQVTTNRGHVVPATFTTLSTERKERLRATPFGFGISPASLTDSQWAILGALGLSRGPRSLW